MNKQNPEVKGTIIISDKTHNSQEYFLDKLQDIKLDLSELTELIVILDSATEEFRLIIEFIESKIKSNFIEEELENEDDDVDVDFNSSSVVDESEEEGDDSSSSINEDLFSELDDLNVDIIHSLDTPIKETQLKNEFQNNNLNNINSNPYMLRRKRRGDL